MKKQIIIIAVFLISMVGFAQKSEMKMLKKAISGKNFTEALATIKTLDGMSLDNKTKAKFLYFKTQALNATGKFVKAASAIQALTAIENRIGKNKYGKLAAPILVSLTKSLSDRGIKEYETKNYKLAKNTLEQVYNLSKKDTTFLEYAANASYLDKDFDKALNQFNQLKDLGYTNIATTYSAVSLASGKTTTFNSEKEMNSSMNKKIFKDQKVSVSESKAASIIKNIAYIYVEKGDNAKAIEAIQSARKADPKDVQLILSEAQIELKLNNKARFGELMKEALTLDPTNANLYYNIGVINQQAGKIQEAKDAYKKAIELDPTNAATFSNLATAMLSADKAIVDELNANLNDFDKYDQIKAKQLDLYREVLPFVEKAYQLKGDDKENMRTLMSIYENLDMMDKMKAVKAVFDGL